MTWTRNPGRVVGFWYLLLVLGGPLRLIYIPNRLFVHDNAAATAGNIAAHEWLFRFGMLSDLFGAVVLIFLVLAFYRLFKGVDQQLAVLLVIVGGVMPALINFVNVVSDAGALMFARTGGAGGSRPISGRVRWATRRGARRYPARPRRIKQAAAGARGTRRWAGASGGRNTFGVSVPPSGTTIVKSAAGLKSKSRALPGRL